MKKNYFFLIGLLGFIGVLGVFTDNPGLFGFFGFFGFFAYKKEIQDERFKANVNKAGKNAFMVSIILFPLVSIYFSLTKNFNVYGIAYAINFAIQILVFSLSLVYYEDRG